MFYEQFLSSTQLDLLKTYLNGFEDFLVVVYSHVMNCCKTQDFQECLEPSNNMYSRSARGDLMQRGPLRIFLVLDRKIKIISFAILQQQ